MDAGHLAVLTIDEVAFTTGFTFVTVSAVPSHAHPLSFFPLIDGIPALFNRPDNFMSRNPRVFDAGHHSIFYKCIAVADTSALSFQHYFFGAGLVLLFFFGLKHF